MDFGCSESLGLPIEQTVVIEYRTSSMGLCMGSRGLRAGPGAFQLTPAHPSSPQLTPAHPAHSSSLVRSQAAWALSAPARRRVYFACEGICTCRLAQAKMQPGGTTNWHGCRMPLSSNLASTLPGDVMDALFAVPAQEFLAACHQMQARPAVGNV